MAIIDQLYFWESILYEFMIHNVFSYEKIQDFRSRYLKGLEGNNKELSEQAITEFKENTAWYLQEQRQHIDMKPFGQILDHIEHYYKKIMPDEFHEFRWYQYSTLLFTYVFLSLAKDQTFKEYYLQYIDQTIITRSGDIDIEKLLAYQFNRLGYWMATGSGKTLLMYAIVYMYCKLFSPKTDTFYILVPSDELRKQHTQFIRYFSEWGLWYVGGWTVIDFDAIPLFGDHQVRGKLTTISWAKNAQLSPNSVLMIDEAHKGASNEAGAIEWLKNQYIAQDNTMLFEFSATFQEAFKSEKKIESKENLFDYYHFSGLYKYNLFDFNSDGFGKDYIVQAVKKTEENESLDKRRLVCDSLVNFALQLKWYKELEKQTTLWSKQWIKNDTYLQRRNDGLRVYKPLFLWLSWKLDDKPTTAGGKQSETTLTAILRSIGYIFSHLDEFEEQIQSTWWTARLEMSEFVSLLTGQEYTTNTSIWLQIWYDKQNDEIKLRLGKHIMIINTWQNAKIAERLKEDEQLSTSFAYQDFMQSSKLFDQVDKNEDLLFLFGSRKFIEGWDSKRPSTILLFKMWWTSTVVATQILGRWLRLYGIDGDGYRHLNYTTQTLKNKKLEYLEQIAMFGYDIDEFEKFIEALAWDTYRVGIIKKREYANTFKDYLAKNNIHTTDDSWISMLFKNHFPVLQDTIGEEWEDIDIEAEQMGIKKQSGKLFFVYKDWEIERNLGSLRGKYELFSEVIRKKLLGWETNIENVTTRGLYRKTYKEMFWEENVCGIVENILKKQKTLLLEEEGMQLVSQYIADIELITDRFSQSLDSSKHQFNVNEQQDVINFYIWYLENLIETVGNRLKNYKFNEINTEVSSLKVDNLIDEIKLDFTLKNKEDQELVDLFFGDAPKLSLEKNYEDLDEQQQKAIKKLFTQQQPDKHIYERLYYLPKVSSQLFLHDINDVDVIVRRPDFSPYELNVNKNEEEKIMSILSRIKNNNLDDVYDIFYLRNLVGKKGIYLQYEDITGQFAKFFPDFLVWFINKNDTSDVTIVYLEPKWDWIDKNREQKEKRLQEITSMDVPDTIRNIFTDAQHWEQKYSWIKVLGVMQMEY